MKKICICTACLGINFSVAAQVINQDASGKSSIIAQGTTLNLNVTETQVQASHYGLFRSKVLSQKHWFYGADLTAKNSAGIAAFYNEGRFSPDGSISLVVGKRLTHFFYVNDDAPQAGDLTAEESKILTAFGIAYRQVVEKLTAGTGLPPDVASKLKVNLQDLDMKGMYKIDGSVNDYNTGVVDAGQLLIINKIISDLKLWIAAHRETIDRLLILNIQLGQTPVQRHVPNSTTYWYLRGGMSANQFSYDQGYTFTDFTKRFVDTTTVTYHLAAGYTYQLNRHLLGINIGYAHQSNKDQLSAAEYKYSYSDTTIKSGKLSKDKAFTAYSGVYGSYGKLYLNIDYQYLFDLNNRAKQYFALGPYLRWNNTLNTSLAKNNTVLGVSANYIDAHAGKFLGGIYLQSSDITGQSTQVFRKSISFGLLVRVSLSSMFFTN